MPLTKANVYSSNVLIGDGVGTTGAPGSYFGFGQSGSSAASTGPRIQAGSGNPNGVVSSPIGSMWFDSASGTIYRNTDGATAWVSIAAGSSGGAAVLYDSGTLSGATATLGMAAGIPQTYTRLRGFLYGRSSAGAAVFDTNQLSLNADVTANNYDRAFFNTAVGGAANNSRLCGNSAGNTADANMFNSLEWWIDNYTAVQFHTCVFENGEGATKGAGVITTGFTRYCVAAAVVGMQFTLLSGGNFVAGSRMVIIGE